MATEHLYVFEFKDVPNQNQYLGPGTFRQTGTDTYESYLDLSGTNVRFPKKFYKNGVMYQAEYPDGTKGFVDVRYMAEFDFDPDSAWY